MILVCGWRNMKILKKKIMFSAGVLDMERDSYKC